ncbi:MAG: universal stress protein [Beijerinckiaceae bacterium]|nr:universal stress protein [Beijerinckiaceae bacterium]MCZ8301960.1 universal stress protein [Beijerinckiaceae bacterium]
MPTAKSLTSVHCIIRVAEEAKSAALSASAKLAESTGAYLGVTVITPKAHVPFSLLGSSYVAPMMADLNQRALTEGEKLIVEAKAQIAAAGLSAHVEMTHDLLEEAAARAVRQARATDLIIVDQPKAVLDVTGLILEEALFRSGRPILVASPRATARGAFQRAVIGWDGSPHAARAVSDMAQLFPGITQADIVVVSGEKPLERMLPGADLAHHLARKGIETKLVEKTVVGESVGAVLDRHAVETGADLLVMGGFGHSRIKEFLFGGVTVELTQSAHVPLLMAY